VGPVAKRGDPPKEMLKMKSPLDESLKTKGKKSPLDELMKKMGYLIFTMSY
jgi:hypothetical protein